ncbi:hypothetical protein [Francisella sp. 19X1-34]|uniref:hypothetical protein n=1 Tax=Francisella sp. 19X1-34 TaxID=3087177 RepID=UPI002E37B12F|nr:hypothetical protein [Francisella sp. 19X1-34]MED7789644.1 hypothetical protein [Francisella sp. 19X1-34]
MNKQYAKENVCEIYNKISKWFYEHRSLDLFEKPYLDSIIALGSVHKKYKLD